MKRRVLLSIFALLALMLACGSPSAPTTEPASPAQTISTNSPPPPAEHRIGVRTVNGEAEFYDRVTGEKFYPRGAALWRWKHWPPEADYFTVIDTIFNTEYGQLDSALAQLPIMREDGFNVVRLWFNACWGGALGCLDQPQGGLNRGFLLNMKRFMEVAKENGIYLILTMDALPDSRQYQALLDPYRGRYKDFNLEFMTQGGVQAQSNYQTDLIRGLMDVGAPMDTILAFQIKEEAYFEENNPPFTGGSGTITPANGQTYDLSDPAQKRAAMEDSWLYYIEQVSQAIKAVDPTALVGMGFFVQHGPNPVLVGDPRIVYLDKVLNESALDFVAFSAYPGFDLNMRQTMENFDVIGYGKKPLMIGEFGAFRESYSDVQTAAMILQEWQVDSCEFGIDGWQAWTWDGGGAIRDDFWHAVEGEGAIRRALSPAHNPDPCAPGEEMLDFPNLAYGKPVKTSANATHLPFLTGEYAVDLSINTQWNAGSGPPQWIEIDLLKPSAIATIRLVISQEPGFTVHRVLGKSENGSYQELYVFRGETQDWQTLEYTPPQPWQGIRFVRIETTVSDSWVGWKEIEIIAP
ncbi:MAG: hypothetical protein HFACDABA_00713 [Anaerolineales bacterium]|nr:hypothetical protein [Anaerolineales bacterium]